MPFSSPKAFSLAVLYSEAFLKPTAIPLLPGIAAPMKKHFQSVASDFAAQSKTSYTYP
jgi:hypothetical protein